MGEYNERVEQNAYTRPAKRVRLNQTTSVITVAADEIYDRQIFIKDACKTHTDASEDFESPDKDVVSLKQIIVTEAATFPTSLKARSGAGPLHRTPPVDETRTSSQCGKTDSETQICFGMVCKPET